MFSSVNPRIYILIYSIVASFLLISNNSFNYTGWAIFGIAQTVIILHSKIKKTQLDWFFALVAALSAVNFAINTNLLNLFFSVITFLYTSGWLISKLPNDRFLKVFHLFTPYLHSLINALTAKDNLPRLFGKTSESESNGPKVVENKDKTEVQTETKPNHWPQTLLNISITLFVLAIIVPLLSFANPQFGKYIGDFFNLQWIRETLNWLVENIFSASMILRGFVFAFLYNVLPRLISYCQNYVKPELEVKKDFPLSIPKIATVFTLLAFLIVQIQTTLNPGLLTKTAGNIASETFFHLSVVCFVVFGLIYLNFKDKINTKIWSLILLVQTLILVGIAFNSDWSYVTSWGLTHKRLYGFSILAIVLGIICVFTYYAFRNSRKMIQGFAIVFCLISAITNLVNMDRLIFKNPPKEATGIEQNYVNALSLDTRNLKERYTNVVSKYNTFPKGVETAGACGEMNWIYNYNKQITFLKEKYSTLRFLDWNFTEFSNYQGIKNTQTTLVEINDYMDLSTSKKLYEATMQNCYQRQIQSNLLFD
jgi:Domain of unknown function (DUF4173)